MRKLSQAKSDFFRKAQLYWTRLAGITWLETALFVVILVVFVVCAGYFALNLDNDLIPDESSHFYLSTQFATTWGTPAMTDHLFELGNIQLNRQPFVYYWINGRLLNLLYLVLPGISEWRQLLFLRMFNVLYSTGTVIFAYLLALQFLRKRWWPLLVAFLTTNTLMFVFLSGGVSYDNLANLCSVAGIFYLFRVLEGKKFITYSLTWFFFIGLGVLVKKTILPLALVMFIFWLIYLIRNRASIDIRREMNWKIFTIGLLTLAIMGINLSIYGVNLVKFKALVPNCTDLHTQQQCDLSVFVKRAQDMEFPKEKITLREVIEQNKLNPVYYFQVYWLNQMQTTIYGIMGHQVYYPLHLITFYWVFYLFVYAIVIKYWERRNFIYYTLLGIAISYLLAILLVSYNEELISNFQHTAIQGRYLFPVMVPVYLLVVDLFSRIANRVVRRVSIIYTVLLFAVGGPVLFLLHFASRYQLNWFV